MQYIGQQDYVVGTVLQGNSSDISHFEFHSLVSAVTCALRFLSCGDREVQYSGAEISIAPAQRNRVHSVSATWVEQIARIGWQRNAVNHLVNHLCRVVCLTVVVDLPILRAQTRVKVLAL